MEEERMQDSMCNCEACPYSQIQSPMMMGGMHQMACPMMNPMMMPMMDPMMGEMMNPMMMMPIIKPIGYRDEENLDDEVEDVSRPMQNPKWPGKPIRRPGWYYCYWNGYKWKCPWNNKKPYDNRCDEIEY